MKSEFKILTIYSDKKELGKVESFLAEIFSEHNLSKKYFNKVLLCTSEAVINSIDHGNNNDRHKKVSIEIGCFIPEIDIIISDEGDGFDYSKVEDPTLQKNRKKERGRGIHIIKSLTDELEFKNEGKRIRFKLKVSE